MGKKLRTHEAAEQLGVSESTLRWWRHVNRGPAYYKPGGGAVLYSEADIEAWLAAGRCEPSATSTPAA